MTTSTNRKVNELTNNQNEMIARVGGLPVRTNVKAGGLATNHNETLFAGTNAGLRVRTNVKAGGAIVHD